MTNFQKHILFHLVWGLCLPFVAIYYLFSDLKSSRFGNKSTAFLKLAMVKQEVYKKAFGEGLENSATENRFKAEVNKLIKKQERKALYKQK